MILFLNVPSIWTGGHIVLGISRLDLKEKNFLFFFLAKVTGVSGLCDMVWLLFSSHYLGGLSPKVVTVLKWQRWPAPSSLRNHTVTVERSLSRLLARGCSIQPLDGVLPPTHVPISYPHPVRPISVFPLLLANLHNYSLPFFLEPDHGKDFPQVSVP